ncbi:MAG: MAPEG family protein [Polymorphobacter sp.]|uniref:MAPEG family protein n=1 Tax=Polymorphobacter sp. TaxID=1909290 RepID=UPI003A8A27EE
MADYPLSTIALALALLTFFGIAINVGRARFTWNVPAPASSGHPEFDKRYRVQMNTLEQLILLVPAVLLSAHVLGDMVTAALTFTWSIGRIIYARSYYADPAKRGPGFGLTLLPSLIMIIAAIVGAVLGLMGQ